MERGAWSRGRASEMAATASELLVLDLEVRPIFRLVPQIYGITIREWASFPFFLTSHAKLLCFVDRLRVSASFKLHPSSFCKQVLYLHLLTGYFPNKIPSLHLPSEAGEGQGGYQTGHGTCEVRKAMDEFGQLELDQPWF